MRASSKLKLACLFGVLVLFQGEVEAKKAPFVRGPDAASQRIAFGEPQLAPIAHTFFCIQHRGDCEAGTHGDTELRAMLPGSALSQIANINADVNARIAPERNNEGVAGEKWLLFPARGDCNDYAVSKRHALLVRGWPSQALLLAEVVTTWGEHHLVLVVRSEGGDLVLDSLTGAIVPWTRTSYQWLRIQSPHDPRFWLAVHDGKNDLPRVASNERRPAKPQQRADAERRAPKLNSGRIEEENSRAARVAVVSAFAGLGAKDNLDPLWIGSEASEPVDESAPTKMLFGSDGLRGALPPFEIDERT